MTKKEEKVFNKLTKEIAELIDNKVLDYNIEESFGGQTLKVKMEHSLDMDDMLELKEFGSEETKLYGYLVTTKFYGTSTAEDGKQEVLLGITCNKA